MLSSFLSREIDKFSQSTFLPGLERTLDEGETNQRRRQATGKLISGVYYFDEANGGDRQL